MELALKARICRTLKWQEFPETTGEFQTRGLQSVKTHDLAVLLRFSGIEVRVHTRCPFEWSRVIEWNPESRYRSTGVTAQNAADMVGWAERLLRVL